MSQFDFVQTEWPDAFDAAVSARTARWIPALLYSSPYTGFSPRGVDGVFGAGDAAEIVSILRSVSKTAAA